jgi:hypothetical protein
LREFGIKARGLLSSGFLLRELLSRCARFRVAPALAMNPSHPEPRKLREMLK